MNKNEVRRRAGIAAVDANLNRLIFGLPLGAAAAMAAHSIAGGWGVGAMALIAASQVIRTRQQIEQEKEAIAKDDRATLIKYTPKPDRDKLREVYAVAEPAPTSTTSAPQPPAVGQWTPVEFNRQELLDSSTGILLLGNSGSGKTTLAQYLCQGMNAPCLVLDPHYDPDKPVWGTALVIKDKDAILAAMEWLMDLLEQGDKRPLCVVADEYPSIRLHAIDRKSKVADKFIIKYGSEGRKYNKFALFCSQSGNVKSLGLSGQGDFVESFTLIRLGKIATKDAQNRPNRDKYNWLCSTAYALTINSHDAALHPNLGHHAQVTGEAKPEKLEAFNPPPLPPDIAAGVSHHITPPPPKAHHTGHHTDHTSHHITSHCPECDSAETVSNGTAPNGDRRRKCKSCGKTWAIAAEPTPTLPSFWSP